MIWFYGAAITLALAFGAGCLNEASGTGLGDPIMLLERGGTTAVAIVPATTEQLGDGIVRYTGAAQAQIGGNAQAGRADALVEGTAEATVNENTGERDFTFTSNGSSDLGWPGLDSGQVTIVGSGPFTGGTATLSSGAILDDSRAAGWGFTTTSVNVSANLAVDSPLYTVYADTGSVGNPIGVIGAPNPGGMVLNAQGMGLVFAPVAGDSAVGPVAQGNWVKFVLPGSVPLSDGVLLTWDTQAATLQGSGAPGYLDIQGSSVIATIDLAATSSSSTLSFTGTLDPPQLGILQDGSGTFWTDASCNNCADLHFEGHDLAIDTMQIPLLEADQQIRDGVPTSSIISASGVNGSLGPVTINSGNLSVDFGDPANMVADLQVSGSVMGIPVTTTFHGPFTIDAGQMAVDLSGDLYLNVADQVILDGDLHVVAGLAGSGTVSYVGNVSLPAYGANFTVDGDVAFDLTQQTVSLDVQASGSVGPISVSGVDFQLALAPAGGGYNVNGSLAVGSISAGTASLTNLQIGISGNTASSLNATINSSSNRAQLTLGTMASVSAYGSATYDLANNTFNFSLNFDGRVSSWQITNGSLTVNWAGSDSVTGSISIGSISNGQVTISNAVVDFTASTSSVTATLRPTTITAGSMVSATVSGNLTYNLSTNTATLNLSASGRVASWNVSGVTVAVTWPGSGNITGTVTVGQVSNGQVTISNAVIDFTASTSSVTATLRPTTITAGSLVSATVSGTATYSTSTSKLTLSLSASGRVGPVNVSNVQANVTWPLSGNITGSVSVGTVTYGPATLTNTTIGFTASTSSVSATISSTLNIGDPFRLNIGLSGNATYNLSTNNLAVTITTGSGTMWGKPITGNVTFTVNVTGSTISGSASTSSLKFNYDKFGITLSNTSLSFAVSGGTVSVSGSGNVAVTGPMGNGWLSGSGSFTISGNVLRSTSYHITMNNVNKTITWVDIGPRNGTPLTVDILAGSVSYDAEGKMTARVDTGFPFYCEDLEFKIHAWGDQNVLRVDFEGSYVLGLFGAAGHMDVYDFFTNSNPPMYGYADVRITFFWFRYQTWNGQSLDNGSC